MAIARIITRAGAFVRNLFHRARVDDALDEELRAYVAGVAAEKVRGGMSARDAERAARLELGGYDVVKERVRDVRTGALFDGILRDCRFAARTLRKTPVFTVVAVLALALGIGATTTMLSVVRSVLVEPLAYADADRLAVILHDGRNPASPRNFSDWRAQTRSFSDMAAAEYWSPDLTSGDNPTQVPALRITSRMLPMLGVAPVLGRVFSAAEEEPGHDHVVVLSYGLWQRMFAGRRDVVGSTVSLDGSIYTVIGVMPKSFVVRAVLEYGRAGLGTAGAGESPQRRTEPAHLRASRARRHDRASTRRPWRRDGDARGARSGEQQERHPHAAQGESRRRHSHPAPHAPRGGDVRAAHGVRQRRAHVAGESRGAAARALPANGARRHRARLIAQMLVESVLLGVARRRRRVRLGGVGDSRARGGESGHHSSRRFGDDRRRRPGDRGARSRRPPSSCSAFCLRFERRVWIPSRRSATAIGRRAMGAGARAFATRWWRPSSRWPSCC